MNVVVLVSLLDLCLVLHGLIMEHLVVPGVDLHLHTDHPLIEPFLDLPYLPGLGQCILQALPVPVLFLLTHLDPVSHPLVVFPSALLHSFIGEDVDSLISLLAIDPLTHVGPPIGPDIDPEPIFLVVPVPPMVEPAISPLVGTESMHHVVLPLPTVAPPILPLVNALLPMNLVVMPLPYVLVPIRPEVSSHPLLPGILIEAYVLTPITPLLPPFPILLVPRPVPAVARLTPSPRVHTKSISFICQPLPIVDIAIHMNEGSPAIGHIVFPIALELSAIRPHLDSIPMSNCILLKG
mmetsp:Transcript_18806/g.17946  ORF Transcript_18806/g.17946 Transcript_18806/m.17946 type:complete len:294 (-) Transcript_18806:322-1203(-)